MFDQISSKIPEDLMRIAFITYEFPPDNGKGGIGTYVKQVAEAMSGLGWDVQVFAGSPHRSGFEMEGEFCVHWVQCRDSLDFKEKVLKSFSTEQEALPFDLMECPEIGGNAWDIKKQYPNVPLIIRLHAPNHLVETLKKRYIPFFAKLRFVLGGIKQLKWDLGYWRKYEKNTDPDFQFIQLADFITAPSIAMRDWVVTNWSISVDRIAVLPNIFVPSQQLLQLPIPAKFLSKQIVFFGRLNVLKGLVNASIAMKKILQQYPDWSFKVIGDDGNGPTSKSSMRTWMQKILAPVLPQIQFADGMDYEALPAAIANAEIVLLPSLFESYSYTCAEAMAAGKAIVGSNVGGMAMLLQHEKSGLLANPESSSEIYNNLKKLIEDDETRYQLALNARERIVQEWDAERIILQFKNYYKRAVSISVAKN